MPSNTSRLKGLARVLRNPAWVAFSWFGMTAGVSVLATIARFRAPAAPREAVLDIGRVTFAMLNKAELAALVLTLLLVRISGRARELWGFVAALVLVLMAQSAWLLPALEARALEVISGVQSAPVPLYHDLYTALEVVKLLLLLALGFRALLPATARPAA